ncbi:MAG: stage II sporulation protein R [Oscillospiraceae bacterium]|nr:stage II sporulation protein R [Oscillospiraceae bacterium]
MKNIIGKIKDLNNSGKIVNIAAVFCACILITSCFCAFMPVNGEHKIYDSLIRLHVLANSDSKDDQNLKLEVRDYILSDIDELTQDCKNAEEAGEKIQDNLEYIELKIKDFINQKQKDYDYSVKTTLSREVYPEKIYTDSSGEDYIFPSGKYNSLRIIIGEGDGKNWWCVLFPPLCLSGSKIEDELAVAGYSNDQINILKKDKGSKYVIRFKILELLADLFK